MKYLYILLIFAISCKSIVDPSNRPCKKLLENDFSEILFVENSMDFETQNFTYTDIRFLCVESSTHSHKVMFDRFGEWKKEIISGKHNGSLIWEDMDIFGNGEKYTIITSGIERIPIHTAFAVFDKDGKDMLSTNSDKRLQFQTFFTDLIRNQNSNKKKFYEIYREKFGI